MSYLSIHCLKRLKILKRGNEMRLVFLGPPGVGKGTQASAICNHFNILHLSTGDILRSEIENKSQIGQEAKSFMDQGELVPDTVLLKIIQNKLNHKILISNISQKDNKICIDIKNDNVSIYTKNKLPYNCHYFMVQDNEFNQWINKRLTFEEVLGTRRFTYERYPNKYNVKIYSRTIERLRNYFK